MTRSDDLIDGVEAFLASENSHPAPAWTDDLARWRDRLRDSALSIEYENGAQSLIAIGPKSRAGQYSPADLDLARALCAQVGGALRRVASSLELALREMERARGMQDRIAAATAPEVDGIECSGACERSGALGGDFYELVSPAAGELMTMIGNVQTEGVSGSILMTALKTLIRSEAQHGFELAAIVDEMNRDFWQNASDGALAPVFAARIRSRSRRLEYINAGYQTAFVMRANGRVDRLERNSPALGLNRRGFYRARTIHFDPGDILIAASDGVVEATNAEGIELGEEGLLRILRDHGWMRTRDMPAMAIEGVAEFAGKGAEDRTVIAVGYRDRETRPAPLEKADEQPLMQAVAA